MLGSAIVFLDGTVVALALPKIGQQLSSSVMGKLEAQTYITSGYLATLAAFLILAGAVGDYYGRRRIFIIGVIGFGLASLLCGFAVNLEMLVVARLVQGIAGSLLIPGSLALITNTFEGAARARAFGLWAAVTAALGTLGPPIGGIILDAAGWRAMFLINAPLVLLALFLSIRSMPESRDEDASGNFDWLGALVAVLAVGGLAFGLVRGQQTRWQEGLPFVAIAVGVMATIAFPILMAVRKHPLVPLGLFRRRTFSTINLSTLLIYGALYANGGFQALFLQSVLGYTPLGAALVSLPAGLLLTLFSARVGALSGRLGVRRFLVLGPAIMAAGQAWWLVVGASSRPWAAQITQPSTYVPPLDTVVGPLVATFLFGVGLALMVAPLTTGLMSSVPARNAGIASAINNALSRVGQPLVAATVFIVVSGAFYASLAAAVPGTDPNSAELRAAYQPLNPPPQNADPATAAAAREASTGAFHLAVIVGAALLAGGAVVNGVGLRGQHGEPSTDAAPRTAAAVGG